MICCSSKRYLHLRNKKQIKPALLSGSKRAVSLGHKGLLRWLNKKGLIGKGVNLIKPLLPSKTERSLFAINYLFVIASRKRISYKTYSKSLPHNIRNRFKSRSNIDIKLLHLTGKEYTHKRSAKH